MERVIFSKEFDSEAKRKAFVRAKVVELRELLDEHVRTNSGTRKLRGGTDETSSWVDELPG